MRTRSASSQTAGSISKHDDAKESKQNLREEPEGKTKGGVVKAKNKVSKGAERVAAKVQGSIKKSFLVRKNQSAVKVVKKGKQEKVTHETKEENLVQEKIVAVVLPKDEWDVKVFEYRSHLVSVDDRFQQLIAVHSDPPLVSASDICTRPQTTFHYLVRAITYQQLAGKAAATIYGRFCTLFTGGASETPSLEVLANTVSPAQVLAVGLERLRSVGLSERKASYILGVAGEFHNGELSKIDISSLTDYELGKALLKLRGVGQWTVDMLLIFHLRRPDILPVGDLGVRKGFQLFFKLKDLPAPQAMIDLAEKWRPYRSYASWYMWRLCELGSLPTA